MCTLFLQIIITINTVCPIFYVTFNSENEKYHAGK